MPYLFRQSPLNAIWEGSGNVICLDVLRTIKSDPEYAILLLFFFALPLISFLLPCSSQGRYLCC
jgi:hypothetical protein